MGPRSLRPVLLATLLGAAPAASDVTSHSGPAGTLSLTGGVAAPADAGWGFYRESRQLPCLPDDLRQAHWQILRANRTALQLPPPSPDAVVLLDWPLALAPGRTDFGYHGISNFVDQDPQYPDFLLDYDCGARTYDLASGYNHQGVDFFTWPFAWKKMAEDAVHVVAAAAGTIVTRLDGNFDQNCGFGNCNWNAVYVQHADGSVAWYGHMKNGSLTTKGVGQAVSAGEYLGVVGSSGCSTAPHLHMELYDSGSNLIEAYAGPCNSLNPGSWWNTQRPYYDSAINALLTHSSPPVFPSCPGQETTNEAMQFAPGQTAYFAAYYRDQLSSQVSQYQVLRPDQSVYSAWSHSSSAAHYAASYWYWSLSLPQGGPMGVWTFRVTYENVVYDRPFAVGNVVGVPALSASPTTTGLRGSSPNPFGRTTDVLFDLARSGAVRLVLFDVGGRHVRTLVDSALPAGRHSVVWDGRDDTGGRVAAGVYVYRLEAGGAGNSDRVVFRP